MKIAYVRGDFLSSWEIANSQALIDRHDVTFFVGKYPVIDVPIPSPAKKISLWSPADLNFGKVNRYKMSVLNRLFVDAHMLFGLEDALKGFDVAYVSETFYGFTHQCLLAKKKGYVKSVVSHASENTPFNNEGIYGRKEFKQQAIAEMDRFVAITDGAKEVLIKEGCDSGKIVRSQPGVDLNVFKPLKITQFCDVVKNDKIKLIFVGRLIPEKGIKQILDIFSNLPNNCELVIVGTGPYEDEVKSRAKLDHRIIYLGRVSTYEDMAKVYNLGDIYLHYSIGSKTWVEQYGFSLIEAMACGLPVVGLDKGSVKEVVGVGGVVVPAEKYVMMLMKLINDSALRKKTSVSALHIVRQKYNAYKHSLDLEKIFLSTL